MTKPVASDDAVVASGRARAVEIRVHGVGDHHDWSALGAPSVVPRPGGPATETALPPDVPDHPLRLLNWSRTSRRRAGWVWYLVLPLTLVNVAGHMTPATGAAGAPPWVHRLQRGAVHLTAAALTVATYVWLVAIVETFGRWGAHGWSTDPRWGSAVAIAGGAVVAAVMVLRHLFAPEARTARRVLGGHVVLVAAVAAFTAWVRPAQVLVPPGSLLSAFTTVSPPPGAPLPLAPEDTCAPAALVTYLDPLTVVVLGSVLLVLVAGAALLLAGWTLRRDRRLATPVAMSGPLLVAAIVSQHSVVGSFRMVVDNVLAYLARMDLLPGAAAGTESDPGARTLLPRVLAACARRQDQALDLYAWLGMTALLAVGVAVVVANLGPGGAGPPPLGARGAAAPLRWARRLVICLPTTTLRILLIAGLLWVGLLLGLGWALFGTDAQQPWNVSIVVVHVVGALVTVLALVGRGIAVIRTVLGQLADVMGFWPVRDHPLAGASYRERVVAGLHTEIHLTEPDATVVVVAHSQGAVLAAWTLAGPGADVRRKVVLVTCGSPLYSLYALLFPTHIDETFFTRVRAGAVEWANFWRDTDPIATSIGSADRDFHLDDPVVPDGPVLGHDDYWVDPVLLAYVAQHVAAAEQRST